MKSLRRAVWLIAVLGAIGTFVGIYVLTEQTPSETTALSAAARERLSAALGFDVEAPEEYAPTASKGWGGGDAAGAPSSGGASDGASEYDAAMLERLVVAHMRALGNVRKWAHVPEFFTLGVFVYIAALLWPERSGRQMPADPAERRERVGRRLLVGIAVCAACSLFDQTHKLFVPGREFDVVDLPFDVLGYLGALGLVVAVHLIARRLGRGLRAAREGAVARRS